MPAGRYQTNSYLTEPAASATLVTAKSSTQKIFVQKIVYSPTTYVAGTVLNFLDSLTLQAIGAITVLPVASAPDSNQYVLNFDNQGFPLSAGASLKLSVVSGGVAGTLLIEAYQTPLYVRSAYVAPSPAGYTA